MELRMGGFKAWQPWQLPCLSQTWKGQSYVTKKLGKKKKRKRVGEEENGRKRKKKKKKKEEKKENGMNSLLKQRIKDGIGTF